MHREQSIDTVISTLKKLEHEIKSPSISLAESLHVVEQAAQLVEKVQKEYFDQKLSVVQVQSTASGSLEEVSFLCK